MSRTNGTRHRDGHWYLFGLLPGDAEVPAHILPPFDEACVVEVVRVAGLKAVVARLGATEVPRSLDGDPERFTALVRDHDHVLRAVRTAQWPLIPLPFGTVFGDRDVLSEKVEAEREHLDRALSRLASCDEWGVHVTVPREAPLRAVRALTRQVFDRLAACAKDAVIEPIEPGATEERPSALSAAFLVDRARLENFHHTVADLRRHWGMAGGSITVSGPWPAYQFAGVDLGSARSREALVLLGPLSAPERAWATT